MASEADCKEYMKKKDFYDILGVSKDCTDEQLKKAYRKLALMYHPDKNKNPTAQEVFKKVATAYDCLSNPDKRSTYDRYGNDEPELHQRHYQQHYGESPAEQIFRAFFQQNGGFEDMFQGFQFQTAGPGGFYYSNSRPQRHHQQHRQHRQEHHVQPNRGTSIGQICMYVFFIYIFFGGIIAQVFKYLTEEQALHQFEQSSTYAIHRRTQLLGLSFYVRQEYLNRDQYFQQNYENIIEREYIQDITQECKLRKAEKQKLKMEARNAWLQTTRNVLENKANSVDMRSCDKLERFKNEIPNFRSIYKL